MFGGMLADTHSEELAKDLSKKDPVYSKMEAGYNAALEPESDAVLDTYFNVLKEQEELGYSPSSVGLKDALHEERNEMLNYEASNMVADSNMDVQSRANVLEAMPNLLKMEDSLAEIIGREAATQDDDSHGVPVSDEYDNSRAVMGSSMKQLYQYRAAQQAVIDNGDFVKTEFGLGMVGDFAQLLVPFVEQANVAEALVKVGKGEDSLGSFLMMGNAKKEFFEAFHKMPLDQRQVAIEKFFQIAESSNRTAWMDNGILVDQMKQELLYGGSYSDTSKWIDNIVSLIDLTVIGRPVVALGRGIKDARAIRNTAESASAIARTGDNVARQLPAIEPDWLISTAERVRSGASPVSPIRMVSETNAEKTKDLFNMIVHSQTDEAAEALAGTSKLDAVTDAFVPELGANGVRGKVHNIDGRSIELSFLNPELKTALDRSSINAVTRAEMESASAVVTRNLQAVDGVVSRTNMFNFNTTPTGAVITGAYGPVKGGWANADEAISLTEMALREYGITKADLNIMEKSAIDGKYHKVDDINSLGKDSDFIVGLDYKYDINFSDVSQWDNLSVKRNFLDRNPIFTKFKVSRHLFNPSSMLDPFITLGAGAKVDKSSHVYKTLLDIAKPFADGFRKATPESRAGMLSYMKRANEEGIPFNEHSLKNVWGFNEAEVDALKSFRDYWDNVWYAKNDMEVKNMRGSNYKVYEDANTDTRLFLRESRQGDVDFAEAIFDPSKGTTVKMSPQEVEALYEAGGNISKTRSYQDFGGGVTNQVLVKDANMTRGLRSGDTIYPYREGYYQRIYDAPHFLQEMVVTSSGKKVWKAIKTAGNKVDADLMLRRLNRANTGGRYRIADNSKDPLVKAAMEAETYEASGRTTSRVRGHQLEDSTATIHNTEDANVLSPVDAIISSARSVGDHVSMSQSIEAMKMRFMDDFKDVLEDSKGMVQYPSKPSDIGKFSGSTSKKAADARTTHEYISFLEFGYTNMMDDATRWMLRSLSDLGADLSLKAGDSGLGKVSKVAAGVSKGIEGASDFQVSGFFKNLAFQMYLGTNPLRQFVLNAHQSTLLTARFPKYVASQKMASDMAAFAFIKAGRPVPKSIVKVTGRSAGEYELMWKEFHRSGMPASIDQNSLIKGSMTEIAEANRYKRTEGVLGQTLHASRKIGFDAGEAINLTSAWLAHYDEVRSTKAGLNASDYDLLAGKARNFTFDMNRAGDMPYNSNSLSLLFQFMQVPHKAFLQATNRALSRAQRGRLFLYNGLMFSLPPAAMYSWFGDWLPDQNEQPLLHNVMVQGAEFALFNKFLELSTDRRSDIDYSNMAPMDAYGLFDFVDGILTTDVSDLLTNTPSGQLFGGANPRITNLMNTAVSFVNPNLDEDPVDLSRLFMDAAKLSSGFSNMNKAYMALLAEKELGSRKQVLATNVSTVEAIALAFGFKSMDAARRQIVSTKMYKESKAYEEDFTKWYNSLTRGLEDSTNAQDSERLIKIHAMAYKHFGTDPRAKVLLRKHLDRDYKKGTAVIFDYVMKSLDYKTPEEVEAMSNIIGGEGHEKIKRSVESYREMIQTTRDYKDLGE